MSSAFRAPEVEKSARIRQTAYYAGSALLALLGILQIWTGIDAGQIENIGNTITGLLTLLGGAAPAVAALKVGNQLKTGSL